MALCRQFVILFLSDRSDINIRSFGGRSHVPFDNPHHSPFGDLELLMEARSRISSRGNWIQGRFQDGNRYCLIMALSTACGSRSVNLPNRTERSLARLLAANVPERGFWTRSKLLSARRRLMWFNDDARTSHDDVMEVFDRTICQLTTPAYASMCRTD